MDAKKIEIGGRRGRFGWPTLFLAGAIAASVTAAGLKRQHLHVTKTPEELRDKFEKATQYILKKIDATEEQRVLIRPFIGDLANSFIGYREEHRTLRLKMISALEAERVEREVIDRIRGELLALADRMTNKVTDWLVQASEILTPEQRRMLTEYLEKQIL